MALSEADGYLVAAVISGCFAIGLAWFQFFSPLAKKRGKEAWQKTAEQLQRELKAQQERERKGWETDRERERQQFARELKAKDDTIAFQQAQIRSYIIRQRGSTDDR